MVELIQGITFVVCFITWFANALALFFYIKDGDRDASYFRIISPIEKTGYLVLLLVVFFLVLRL